MNIPNILTIFRIILVPIYLLIFFSNLPNKVLLAGVIFILAGVTDVLDGYIARKNNLITKLGTVLDPFADKLMSFAVLLSFTIASFIPSWIIIILGIKEGIMILVGGILYLLKGNFVMPSNRYGKIATASFYIASLSIVFNISKTISMILFIITIVLNLYAFLNYANIYKDLKHKGAI